MALIKVTSSRYELFTTKDLDALVCKLSSKLKFDIAQSCLPLVIILSNGVQVADHAVFGDYFNEIIKLVGVRWTVDAGGI